jgi:hypothetical protein
VKPLGGQSTFFLVSSPIAAHSMIGKPASFSEQVNTVESCHLCPISASTTSAYIEFAHRGTMVATSIGACPHQFMKTVLIPPPALICMSTFRSDIILPCQAAPSTLDEGYRPSRSAHGFLRVVRIFLSDLIDSSAFHSDSLGREVSVIFTSNGPLTYRWESNNEKSRTRS